MVSVPRRLAPVVVLILATATACGMHAEAAKAPVPPSRSMTAVPVAPGSRAPGSESPDLVTPDPVAKPSTARPAAIGRPLAGKVVVLDPGHNPNDLQHLAEIDRLVNVVTEDKPCDAIGAETDAGYPESDFTYDVAIRAAAILRARGATVVLTRNPSTPYGPCVTQRAAIGNEAHADAAISIHADGGPPAGDGFQVILPGPVGPNDGMIADSRLLGAAVHAAFHADTGEPFADYLGGGTGYTTRTDLGGLNLSTVPKVFIECANMRNATDAGKVSSPAWRQSAAAGIADGITAYLTRA